MKKTLIIFMVVFLSFILIVPSYALTIVEDFEANQPIDQPPEGGAAEIVVIGEKISSKSYYYDFKYTNLNGEEKYTYMCFTISTFKIKKCTDISEFDHLSEKFSKIEEGAEIKILEPWGITPDGEFVKKNLIYKKKAYTGNIADFEVSHQVLRFNTPYLLEIRHFINEDYEKVSAAGLVGAWLGPDIYTYGEIPQQIIDGCLIDYSDFLFTEEEYNKCLAYQNAHKDHYAVDCDDEAYHRYCSSMVKIWEKHSHLLSEPELEKTDTTIIFTLGFAAIFLCIIAVGIILIKRSRTTPNGTPPTVEQNSPDAQDTTDTPVAETKTASPPDVTEPPDSPKEE